VEGSRSHTTSSGSARGATSHSRVGSPGDSTDYREMVREVAKRRLHRADISVVSLPEDKVEGVTASLV